MKRHLRAAGIFLVLLGVANAGESKGPRYKVLPPITQGNFALYPVAGETSFNTERFLTLDEGIASGQVIVTERTQATGLVRPRRAPPAIWPDRPVMVPRSGAAVNELALINNSDRPLILLAGEIVTGGKQDRVVGRDRIIPPHSEPIALGVFCVEPHRWRQTSAAFGVLGFSMAQPSVRSKAMASRNQQEVWNEVAKSRAALATNLRHSGRTVLREDDPATSRGKSRRRGRCYQRETDLGGRVCQPVFARKILAETDSLLRGRSSSACPRAGIAAFATKGSGVHGQS